MKKTIFISSHLALGDQMPLNGMIRYLISLDNKIIFPVRAENKKIISHCFSDLSQDLLEFIWLTDEDPREIFFKKYKHLNYSLLNLGSNGTKIQGDHSFITKCYLQAELKTSIEQDYFFIPPISESDFTAEELSIIDSYLDGYKKSENSNCEVQFPFSKGLCINLDHREDRWNNVKNSSIYKVCDIERYSASTIREELMPYISCIHPQYVRPNIGDTLTLSGSEYGVILSNLSIWLKMVNENVDKMLIMEDDVVFKDSSPQYISETFSDLPDDWDIVQIAAFSGGPAINDSFGKFNGPWFIGNWCYGITLNGAKKLINIVNNSGASGPLDNFIGDNCDKLNIYYYLDMPGTQGNRSIFGSNIRHCGDGNGFFSDPIL